MSCYQHKAWHLMVASHKPNLQLCPTEDDSLLLWRSGRSVQDSNAKDILRSQRETWWAANLERFCKGDLAASNCFCWTDAIHVIYGCVREGHAKVPHLSANKRTCVTRFSCRKSMLLGCKKLRCPKKLGVSLPYLPTLCPTSYCFRYGSRSSSGWR